MMRWMLRIARGLCTLAAAWRLLIGANTADVALVWWRERIGGTALVVACAARARGSER